MKRCLASFQALFKRIQLLLPLFYPNFYFLLVFPKSEATGLKYAWKGLRSPGPDSRWHASGTSAFWSVAFLEKEHQLHERLTF